MADGVWKVVYPWVFGRSKQLSLNKFFDPSTMKKGRDGGRKKNGGKTGFGSILRFDLICISTIQLVS